MDKSSLLRSVLFGSMLGAFGASESASFKASHRLDVADLSFVTSSVSTFESCKDACLGWTSCLAVNFNRRAHFCSLLHKLGGHGDVLDENKVPGVWSWRKPTVNEGDSSCPFCDKTKSCVMNPSDGTCVIAACGEPKRYGKNSANGYLRTVGSRASYKCYNHDTSESYMQIIRCSTDGTWTGSENYCGYSEQDFGDEKVLLKVVEIQVNQANALSNCHIEGASLPTVLTTERRKHLDDFLTPYNSERPKFWMDVKTDGDRWVTSDGREQSMDMFIWRDMFKLFSDCEGCKCAILNYRHWWKLEEKHCDQKSEYICEIEMNKV